MKDYLCLIERYVGKMNTIYNKNITIEQGVSGTSSVSSPILTYSEYMDIKASVYERSRSVKYGDSEEYIYTTEFKIRYNDSTKVINNKFRVKYEDKYYRILEAPPSEYRREIMLICQRFDAD